jgi:HK97 gp10 family phage protein
MKGFTLQKNINKVLKKIDNASTKQMKKALEHNKKAVEAKLGKTGSGRTYKVPGTDRTYTASAPGQPPARYRGILEKSIKIEVEQTANGPQGKIGSTAFQAYWLEMGTRNMRPRPFLENTLREEERTTKQILGQRWF